MGIYVNPDYEKFLSYANKRVFVDKTLIINNLNSVINTEDKFICMVRPRRFGKSLAAVTLNAYYNKSFDSKEIFDKYKISQTENYEKYLNKFNVIYIDFQDIVGEYNSVVNIDKRQKMNLIQFLEEILIDELVKTFTGIEKSSLQNILIRIYEKYNEKFVFIIDEWDIIFREYSSDNELKNGYLKLLRGLFKGTSTSKTVALAYLTGILPIIKTEIDSTLNIFTEVSLLKPYDYEDLMGFTEQEVEDLCKKFNMDFGEMKSWYDGYAINDNNKFFNPNSVALAILNHKCGSYWAASATYESVLQYIHQDFEGIKEDIEKLLVGKSIRVDIFNFQNTIYNLQSKNDVFTLLIYLGYLTYNVDTMYARIPNQEILKVLSAALEHSKWEVLSEIMRNSEQLVEDTREQNAEAVSKAVEKAHSQNSSWLKYNDENSLSCVITMAYIAGKNYYKFYRELPAGKGFADMVLIPYPKFNYPPMVIELKWKKDAQTAINQIKERNYTESIKNYGLLNYKKCLLVGINYDTENKEHNCSIEEFEL